MDTFFAFLFVGSLSCFIIGMIKPTIFNRILKGVDSRKKIALIFGSIMIVSLVLFNPKDQTSQGVNENKNVANSNQSTNTNTNSNTNNSANNAANATSNTNTATAEIKPTEPPSSQPVFATFASGTFQVGTDIKPGTYRTREGSSGCYYSRVSGFSDNLSDIIANENTDDPAIVTIAASDKGFISARCGTWTSDLSAITTDKTTFGNGTFIVNTDILPGTYKSAASEGCYYSRLSGFGGTLSNIISNNNTDAGAIITIAKTDKGFKSVRCGTWTKIK